MAKKKPKRARKPRASKAKRASASTASAEASAAAAKADDAAMPKVGPVKYVGQVRQEMRKVVWPTQRETIVTSILVVIMVILMGIFFFFTDSIISWVVESIIAFGGKG